VPIWPDVFFVLERTYLVFFYESILDIEAMPFAVLALVIVMLGPHRRLLVSE
jgi:hypothetical protein